MALAFSPHEPCELLLSPGCLGSDREKETAISYREEGENGESRRRTGQSNGLLHGFTASSAYLARARPLVRTGVAGTSWYWCQHCVVGKSTIQLLSLEARLCVALSKGKWVIKYIRELGVSPFPRKVFKGIESVYSMMWGPQTRAPQQGQLLNPMHSSVF